MGGRPENLYFSERRIRQWFDGSGIAIPEPTRREFTTPSFGNTVPTVKWTKDGLVRTRQYLADLFERKFDDWIVRDFGAPSPIQFAAGVGVVNFGEFIHDGLPVRALIHISADLDEPSSVAAVCLFRSLDNYADFIPDPSVRSHGSWISSAAPDILRFLHTRSLDDAVICRTQEDLAREAVKIALCQGDRGPYTDRSKGYHRRFTYGETNETGEWCAEIYFDVDLANTKLGPEEGFSRVLIGVPIWVRTPLLRSFLYQPAAPLFPELVRLRSALLQHFRRHQPLRQARELYALTGMTCVVLAHASHDLGHGPSGMTHAQLAGLGAQEADYVELHACALGTQALLAEAANHPREALRHL